MRSKQDIHYLDCPGRDGAIVIWSLSTPITQLHSPHSNTSRRRLLVIPARSKRILGTTQSDSPQPLKQPSIEANSRYLLVVSGVWQVPWLATPRPLSAEQAAPSSTNGLALPVSGLFQIYSASGKCWKAPANARWRPEATSDPLSSSPWTRWKLQERRATTTERRERTTRTIDQICFPLACI